MRKVKLSQSEMRLLFNLVMRYMYQNTQENKIISSLLKKLHYMDDRKTKNRYKILLSHKKLDPCFRSTILELIEDD